VQLYKNLPAPVLGSTPGAKHPKDDRFFWMQGMMGGHKGRMTVSRRFRRRDFTGLEEIDVPTLIIQGDE